MTVSTDVADRVAPRHIPPRTPNFGPRRETLLNAALSSGLCLDLMIEQILDRSEESL